MMHDHVETGTTTDGMEPGGNMAILAYKSLLDDQGMPKMHTELFNQVFNPGLKNIRIKRFHDIIVGTCFISLGFIFRCSFCC